MYSSALARDERKRARRALDPSRLGLFALIGVAAALVLPPFWFLTRMAFTPDRFGATAFTFANFRVVGSIDSLSLWRVTALFALGSSIGAVALGFTTAWLIARTDAPLRSLVLTCAFLSMATPLIVKTIGWILLLGPNDGLLNVLLERAFGATAPPFRLFSLGGMIFVEALLWAPIALLLALPAVMATNQAFEEAALMCGAGRWDILRRVTLPLLKPSALAVLLLSLVRSMEAFETPLLIGVPGRLQTVTTAIYETINSGFTPQYGQASAYSLLLIAAVLVPLGLYYRATRDSARFATVSGKNFRPTRLMLGRGRLLAALWMIIIPLSLAAPLLIMAYASFQTIYVSPTSADWAHFTTANYASLWNRSEIGAGLVNSALIGLISATLVSCAALLFAWTVVRSGDSLRFLLDGLASLPLAFPALVLGMAVLVEFLRLRWIPIYGTLAIVVVAFVIKFLPIGMRFCHAGALAIHKDLEDSAKLCGANGFRIFLRVVLPLTAPAAAATWLYVFMYAIRDLPTALLLSGPGNSIVSVVILDLWNNGEIPQLAALSVAIAAAGAAIGLAVMRVSLRRNFTL